MEVLLAARGRELGGVQRRGPDLCGCVVNSVGDCWASLYKWEKLRAPPPPTTNALEYRMPDASSVRRGAARHANVASYCLGIHNAGLGCFGGINFDLGALAIGGLATGIVMTAKMMSHFIKW